MDRFADLRDKAHWLRQKVLEMAVRVNSGHISTAYSQCELLVALYLGGILKYDPADDQWDGRDRFILSKGQGGIGLYPVLALAGFFPIEDLDRFTMRGSHLGVHAEWQIPGVEVLTGSLGHGLPIATGKAQALLNDGKDNLVFCLLGDGELHEGSNWEAALFAGHQGYENLICIVDRNNQATLGKLDSYESRRDGPGLNPLGDKFRAFGFEVREIDGHSFEEIFDCFEDIRERRGTGRPLFVISNTLKGKGLSLMEDQRMWHYRVPAGADLERCIAEIGLPADLAESGAAGGSY